jgi:hypothetical protein
MKPGDLIMCTDDKNELTGTTLNITVNKVYKAIEVNTDAIRSVTLKNDNGNIITYSSDRFKVITREMKLKRICK